MSNQIVRIFVEAQTRIASAELSRASFARPGASRGRRAAGMLEYLLLGAIAVIVISVILRGQLAVIIQTLTDRITQFIDS